MKYATRREIGVTSIQEGSTVSPRKRILILGGGFAGVYTAMYLQKQLPAESDVEIALVSRENYFVFQPMLAEVIWCRIAACTSVRLSRSIWIVAR
jgi:hypothetical protein